MGFKENILGAASLVTIGEVRIDASRAETHRVEGTVTSHKVEEGMDTTDNYRAKPRQLSIDGTITNTPLSVGYPLETAIDGVRNIVAGNKQPVNVAWEELQRYFDEGVLITITTSLREYTNMAITSLTVTRNVKQGQNLHFSLAAKEIQYSFSRLVTATPSPSRAQEQADKGKDTNKNANDKQDKKLRSAARTGQWKLKAGSPAQ